MTSLRQFLSRFRHDNGKDAGAGPGRTSREPDRRRGDRRRRGLLLHDRETRLRFAAQAAGFGVYDIDPDGSAMHWSPEIAAIAGVLPEEAPASLAGLAPILHPEDRDRVIAKLKSSMLPDGVHDFEDEHRLLRPDGTVRWVKAKGRTFFADEGGRPRPLGASGIVMDITESRTHQQELADSRARLAGLIESTTDAIISLDADQRITIFNPAACRMFRCREEDAIGSLHDRFVPARFRDIHRQHVDRFMESGATGRAMGQAAAFLGVRADGEEFPMEATISKVRVAGQWQLTVIIRDITERVAAEEALRKSEELMRLANEAANIGTYDTDLEGGHTRLSAELCTILGLPVGSMMDLEQLLKYVHPDDREKMSAACRYSLDSQSGGLIRSEHRVIRPDNQVRWLVWRGRTIFHEGPSGRMPVRNIGACLDITDRKHLEEAMQHMNEALERRVQERTSELSGANEELIRSNLELQQFAYIAAHDLQTPLRSISGFAQLLQQESQGRLGDQADVWVAQLVHHVERMHELIQDLLVYSGIDSLGRPFEPTDFRQLFDEVLTSLAAAISTCGAKITCDDLPVITGDRLQLAQVIQNLVDNAIKYQGTEPPRIHVSAKRQDNRWLFSVRDNGIGIAKKHQERIFEVFRRLHSQQTYPGTGIGLAICRRVIQRHGGRIWVESEPGEGCTFYFTLPDQPAEEPESSTPEAGS